MNCADCGSGFIDPLPSDADFSDFYRKDTYHDAHYACVEPSSLPTALPRVQRFLKPGGRLLDFGCGSGVFLKSATQAGFACTGVELEEATRRWAATESGCPVLSLQEVERTTQHFDVIHLGDVLEHVPDPVGTLWRLAGRLAADGAFFIEGPVENNGTPVLWASKAFGALKHRLRPAPASWPPLHLFRATAAAQRGFFERMSDFRLRTYLVWEDGWPYASRQSKGRLPRSFAEAVRRAIAATAVGASVAARPLGLQLGNRFAAVIQRTGDGAQSEVSRSE